MALIRTPIYNNAPNLAGAAVAAQDPERDGYLAKLIKYVPGEVVAAFGGIVALAANVTEQDSNPNTQLIRLVCLAFLIITPGYFWVRSRKLSNSESPRWYFYALSALSFAIWAIAISSNARDAFGVSNNLAEFLLAVGAFGIPFIDELLTRP